MTIGAIILAAGGSRRLGRAKQLVTHRGETLLARVIRVACEAGAWPVVVVLGAECEAIKGAVNLSCVRLVSNANWVKGIATSIHVGLRAVEEDLPDGALILTCDQPRLTAEHLRALVEVFDEGKIAASAYAGDVGVPAIFPRAMFTKLYALSGDEGARSLLNGGGHAMVCVDFPGGEVDVDTPEDMAALE